MIFATSQEEQDRLKRTESFRANAYRLVINGIPDKWTIGYGHTGPEVHEGLVWTREEADEAFAQRLADEFEPAVNRICAGVPTTQGQFDAMISLAYNIGIGAFGHSSVARFHRSGDYDKTADAFELYDHYHGQPNDALHNRRVEEAQRYLDASPTADAPTEQPEEAISQVRDGVVWTPRGSDPIGQNKAVVAAVTGPSVGVLSWWANARHGLGIPEHVVADAVGVISAMLVWFVPHGRK